MLQDLIQTKVNLILTYLMNNIFYQINEKTSKTAFNALFQEHEIVRLKEFIDLIVAKTIKRAPNLLKVDS